jgi:hypothetical protein
MTALTRSALIGGCVSTMLIIFIPEAASQELFWYNTWEYQGQLSDSHSFRDGPLAINTQGETYMASQLIGSIDVDPSPATSVLSSGTGTSTSSICLSKFDQNGTWAWTKRMGNTIGQPQALALDPDGNVYMSGMFKSTVDFDPGPGVVNLTSAGADDIFLAKFDPDGDHLWSCRFGTSQSAEGGWDLAVDASGNAYVMVSARGTIDVDPGPGVLPFTPAGQLTSIIKLDAQGGLVWARSVELNGAAYSNWHIAADGSGNVLMTGQYSGASVDVDPGTGTTYLPHDPARPNGVFIVKWDPQGELLWARGIAGAIPGHLACDAEDNVLVTGNTINDVDLDPGPGVQMHAMGNATNTSWVLKLDALGAYVWSKMWSTNSIVQAKEVVTDQNGNVIIGGIYNAAMDLAPGPLVVPAPQASNGSCSFITALDPYGSYLWSGELGAGQHDAYVEHMATAPDNSLRISGWFYGAMDMDPGPGSTTYTGPLTRQSTMLLSFAGTNGPTGIPTTTNSTANLYPVPTDGPLTITHTEAIALINVRDLRGVLVSTERPGMQRASIDLSALPAGCYLVEIVGKRTAEQHSIVKF